MKSGQFYNKTKLLIVLNILIIAAMLGSACTTSSTAKEELFESQNDGLVIRYLTAPKQLEPSSGTEIFCAATDSDNGELNYEWSATGGEIIIQGEPDGIVWMAPEKTGDYTITVVVTNAEGVKAMKSATIAVTSEPFEQLAIVSMTCLNCQNVIEASRFNEYYIKCDVSNPGAATLNYTWFATIGRITGNGPNASWFTGSQHGNALITVIVTDDKGNKTEGYLAINVNCCH